MSRETDNPGGIGRRQFITGAGAVVGGTVSTLAVFTPFAVDGGDPTACKVLLHEPTRCAGCGVCGLMCSLYHEGEAGPILSRSGVVRDPFTYDFTFVVCQHCSTPRCYYACPLRGIARVVDGTTGMVSVNEDECVGCGICVAACPFDPPRTRIHPDRRVAFSCDRCIDRDDGPICVAYCTMVALSCESAARPRRPAGRSG